MGFCSFCCNFIFVLLYERHLIASLSKNNQVDVIDTFNSTSRYIDELLKI